ncbi:hypothetical protein BH10ACT1_BH10ACT1_43160 [soil metagenome]
MRATRPFRWWPGRLNGRQVNLAIEAALVLAVGSGLVSWSVGDRWNGWATTLHGITGLSLLLLIPAKVRGPVRRGLRRARPSRWLSSAFGVLVLATLALGIVHATGLWFGHGPWSALWTHELFAFSTIPLLLWHLASRPVRPKARDVDRRAVLRLGATSGAAAGIWLVQRPLAAVAGLAGGHRRPTGSHEVASHRPLEMPAVIWFDDHRPADTEAATWELRIQGRSVSIAELWELAGPVDARLDCTGGWWSEQTWNAVRLSALVREPVGRSIRVVSETGYDRRFPLGDLADLYLAVGYEGRPLRASHGAPVRLVVPGRRGPEWVKWVVSVEDDDLPAWLQLPLPLS